MRSVSKYFSELISHCENHSQKLQSPDGRLAIEVEVEPELTEAAQAVIHLMHKQSIPAEVNAESIAKV
jgi:hypothetical protein